MRLAPDVPVWESELASDSCARAYAIALTGLWGWMASFEGLLLPEDEPGLGCW